MTPRYTILICDDSEAERRRFYARQGDNFNIYGVERRGNEFVEVTRSTRWTSCISAFFAAQDWQAAGPRVLDLFYKRPLEDADQLERDFVARLRPFKQQFFRLKQRALAYLAPGGVTVLQRLREVDGVSPDELPVAVYTDKNFNFLPSEDLNTLYRLGAHSVHKDRDEDPSLQISPSSEYFRLLHAIERARSSVSAMRGVFISHGRSPDWMRVQMFLQNDERLSTVELEQLTMKDGR